MMNQVILSDRNRAPIVQIVTWFCLAASTLAFLTHAAIKIYIFRSLRIESGLVLASLVFCVAQSVAVLLQTEHGFGTPSSTLSDQSIQSVLKSEYAATMFLFTSIGFSKLAIVAFVHNLTPSKSHRTINFGVGILSSLWLFCSVLIAAFQCKMPRPWDRTLGQCIDRSSWWMGISITNILTEVAMVVLELGITAQLRITRQKKASVMGIFACRSLVFIAAAVQLSFFQQDMENFSANHDLTLDFWRSAICNQVVQCLAIVTTCLPYTKMFMEGFDSGLMRVDELRRRGEHTSYGTQGDSRRAYQLMDISRSTMDKTISVSKSWAVQVEPAEQASASKP